MRKSLIIGCLLFILSIAGLVFIGATVAAQDEEVYLHIVWCIAARWVRGWRYRYRALFGDFVQRKEYGAWSDDTDRY